MLKPNPDGTATLSLPDQEITLRMPTLDEYGDLMDILDEARFKTMVLAKEALVDRLKVSDEGGAEAYKAAMTKERQGDDIRSEFIVAVIQRLGGVEVTRGSLPRWVASNDLISKLTNHWDTVPFLGSAQAM